MISSLLALGKQRLTGAGVDNPGLDAEVLAALAMGTDRAGLYARLKDEAGETLFRLPVFSFFCLQTCIYS